MNNLDNIYKEFGNEFCLRPFAGAFYTLNQSACGKPTTPNSVVPCCLIPTKQEFKIVDNSIFDSVNSAKWQEIRQKFADGQFRQISECDACIKNEQQGGSSARHGSNQYFAEHAELDLIQYVKETINNNYQVKKILSVDYAPGNYCNYSCIMCDGSASSSRLTFEIQVLNKSKPQATQLNSVDSDFYNIVRDVEIINFTGGETILQPEVNALIDYLVENKLSQKITTTILSNVSRIPNSLETKLKQFKRVVFTCSVDGTGPVIEYQRRGADWATVESNTLKLINHSFISSVVNYVLTAVNAPSFMEFADWVFDNEVEFVSISPVGGQPHLSVSVMPTALRELTLCRLVAGQKKYSNGDSKMHQTVQKIIGQVIDIFDSNPEQPKLLPEFIEQIQAEDLVSKQSLCQVVPEWAPYFKVDQ